ncbi:hypothetical protein ACIQWN_32540 [Streptomyces vinaceus]|uniref:hypothetical protein n=1 Tax=Streptomyces vinaceus TaxID=1960 RepID=UPI0037FF16D7
MTSLTTEQTGHAATIAAVGLSRDLPPRAVTIALATALQESHLRNLPHGDRDSLGLFQQRPSYGWGTAEQVRDPVHAATRFYTALERVEGYADLPLTEAAQKVQRSGHPDAYAKHEARAELLASALTGRSGTALTCSVLVAGLKGQPDAVRADITREFGADGVVGAPSSEGGTGADLHVAVSQAQHGRAVARWAIARASTLGIRRVVFDGHVWTAGTAGGSLVKDLSARDDAISIAVTRSG